MEIDEEKEDITGKEEVRGRRMEWEDVTLKRKNM